MAAVLSKCYRTTDGYYRVQIVPDPNCDSPREADNTALLVTWEQSYDSPDSRTRLPDYLTPAIDRWLGGGRDFSKPLDAATFVRYCRTYLTDRIYAVAALQRGPSGRLQLDHYPRSGGWIDGVALVTSANWWLTMGVDTPHAQLADEILRQEVADYNAWQDGENYGYQIERFDGDSWVDHDACYGFIGDPEGYVLTAALDALPADREEVDEDTVRSAVLEKSSYVTGLEVVIEGFRFQLCQECGNDLEQHLIGPDMFGKPHLWCLASDESPVCPKDGASFADHLASGIRIGRKEALETVRELSDEPGRLAPVLAAAAALLETSDSSEEHA